MYQNIAFVVALILIIPGIIMAFIPMLPALSYMFVVALIFAIASSFVSLSVENLFILLGITLLSIIVDHLSGVLGAKIGGAHVKSLLWGLFGGIIGTFAMPVVGSFLGLFLGVLLSELYYKKNSDKALKAAGSALIGSVFGVVVNVILAIIFSGLFFLFVFF
jgi:hypothetical protein